MHFRQEWMRISTAASTLLFFFFLENTRFLQIGDGCSINLEDLLTLLDSSQWPWLASQAEERLNDCWQAVYV